MLCTVYVAHQNFYVLCVGRGSMQHWWTKVDSCCVHSEHYLQSWHEKFADGIIFIKGVLSTYVPHVQEHNLCAVLLQPRHGKKNSDFKQTACLKAEQKELFWQINQCQGSFFLLGALNDDDDD